MSNPSPSVLVVGAGPSGLVLALALAKHDISVRIIEKSPLPQKGSRGSGIMPRSQELLHFLGVIDDVQTQGERIPAMQSYSLPGGTEPLDTWELLERLDPSPSKPYTSAIELRQDLLEGILRKHLQQHCVQVEFGTQLGSFEQDKEGVTSRLLKATIPADGDSSHTNEDVRSEYLVGADGARGIVRKLLGLTFLGETREADELVVGDVEVSGLNRDFWHLWGNTDSESNQVISLRPCGKGTSRFAIFSTGSFIHEADMSRPDNFRQLFVRHTGRDDITLGEFHWLSYFRPHMRMVNKFGEGRVFVVGDAAHVHSPTGGQGMNSSVQDSFNLAWKLATSLIHASSSVPSPTTSTSHLLASYTSERLPVIAEMLRQTSMLHTLTFQGGALTRHQRGWHRGKHLYLLGVNYRWSEVVRDERSPRIGIEGVGRATSEEIEKGLDEMRTRAYCADDTYLRAGDRAPEAPGLLEIHIGTGDVSSKATSIFDLLDVTKHLVLAFPGDASDEGLAFAASTANKITQLPPKATHTALVLPRGILLDKIITVMGHSRAFIDEGGFAHAGYQLHPDKDQTFRRTLVIVRPDGVVGAIVHSVEGLSKYFGNIFVGQVGLQ